MIWIIALSIVTYLQSLKNGLISDDLTVYNNMCNDKFRVPKMLYLINPNDVMSRYVWKWFKNNAILHHLFNMVAFTSLCGLFYMVLCKFIPEPVAFIASLFFTVHPLNAQIGGWISGRWYAFGAIICLLALNFNNLFIYLFSAFFSQAMWLLPLIMDVPLWQKIVAIYAYIFFAQKVFQGKQELVNTEVAYKNENMRVYPRKLIVALKSFCYSFTLCFLPVKLGWFHELGEPIDNKIKQMNFHFALCLCLVATLALFIPHKASLGLLIFVLGIAPFMNFVTPALFTAERYMTAAVMGWCIFLAYLTYQYPVVVAVFSTYYFTRTQLELWAYHDDERLALNSLNNFDRSGYAWHNMMRFFYLTNRPFLSYGVAKEAEKFVPEFPSTYYQLFMLHNCADLPFFNPSTAMHYLEKACTLGKHKGWWEELERYKSEVKKQRIVRFRENVARDSAPRYIQPPIEQSAKADGAAVVGITA